MTTIIHQRVQLCRDGGFEKCIAKMPSGWAVMGDVQFLPGYCLLLPDPVVLTDMTRLGDAVLAATNAVRINYEMLGNLEPALHAHVFPRFNDEVAELKTSPVWFYDWKNAPQFNITSHQTLMSSIKNELGS